MSRIDEKALQVDVPTSPQTERPPPLLWSDWDEPLVPDESVARRGHDWLRPRGPPNAIPSYEIDPWLRDRRSYRGSPVHYLGRRPLVDGKDRDERLSKNLVAATLGEPPLDGNSMWSVGRRLFALLKPDAADTDSDLACIARYHEVHLPKEAFEILRTAFQQLNPWRLDTERWEGVRREVIAACGVDPQAGLRESYRDLPERLKQALPVDPTKRRFTAVGEPVAAARSLLLELAQRDVETTRDPSAMFLFQALQEAPLRASEPHDGLLLDAVASLGAGNFAHLQARRFPGEPSGPLDQVSESVFDGGDLRVSVVPRTSHLLEGVPLLNRKRRRAEEDDDYNGYDDDDGPLRNGPSTTGNPSGGGRGNNPSRR